MKAPKIIAHRGGGVLGPENTISSINCAIQQGSRDIEIDVMLSSDKVPVVMHDAELGRTVSGVGSIKDYTYAELCRMDAGSWFSTEFLHERVPSLQQVIELSGQQQLWLNIELKPSRGQEEITGQVVGELLISMYAEREKDQKRVCVSSFSINALHSLRTTSPLTQRGILFREVPKNWQEIYTELGCVSVHCLEVVS